MDQILQIQQQIQRLQQEINGISQVCNQLQQSEQSNALQLQQMTQKELMSSQGIRRIQQAASALSQEMNQISNITQQIANQVVPLQRTFQTTGVYPGIYGATTTGITSQITPQFGYSTTFSQPGTGFAAGGQYGAFGQTAQGFNQGQNLSNLGQFQPINLNAFPAQVNPSSQGYSQNQFGTGNQLGYSSQLGSGIYNAGMGTTWQGANQGMLGASMLGSGMQTGAGLGLASYSPYQANQYGFR